MRLEPEERRNYVYQQLDDYGRIYMSCLELFVYKLWSRQRLLLKNNKIYEEKLMTISEVIGTLTSHDTIVENNKTDCEKLEKNIQKIHRVVFIPPNNEADIHMLNDLLVKEVEWMGLVPIQGRSQMMSPLGSPPINREGNHHSVIKSQSSASATSVDRGRTNGNAGGSVPKKPRNNRTKEEDTNGSESSENSLQKIHRVVFIPPSNGPDLQMVNDLLVKEDEWMALAPSPSGSQLMSPIGSGQLDRGNHHPVIVSQSSSSSNNSESRRSNGSAAGSGPKKSRNNRTKDDKEIVKCCAQKGCQYIERDNANNMRKHYRNWHDDTEYPPAPYIKKEMPSETVNQYLHDWMVQRKKKQPRGPRSTSRESLSIQCN